MRLLLLLLYSVLLAAAATPPDAKLAQLSALAARSNNGLIPLSDALFATLTAAPRAHCAVVLLTALDAKHGCAVCAALQPEFELLARSHRAAPAGLLFGVLDFGAGRRTFARLGLASAPVVLLFAPGAGAPHKFAILHEYAAAAARRAR